MTVYLDTSIVIALLDPGHANHAWSVAEFTRRKAAGGPAYVSDIVYCEVSVGMADKAQLDAAIASLDLQRIGRSDDALVRAGKAFRTYKDENKGPKLGVLPDFIIGAEAEVEGVPLMTDNAKDFVGYFPAVEVVSP